jgi:uncharacterized membrane protein YkvA (DUF1232 family)
MAASLGERIVRGRLFAGLKDKALAYVKNPEKLRELVDEGRRKANATGHGGPIGAIWEPLFRLFRLLRAYVRREYTDIPWDSLVIIVAGVLYFLLPFDLIPDFIVGAGFIDDAAVLTWVLSRVKTVIDRFGEWEAAQGQPGRQSAIVDPQSGNR